MPSLKQLLDSGVINPAQLQALSSFARLVHDWNPHINLTGFKSLDAIEERLIGESVLAGKKLPIRKGSVLDFGSGAGIPGLVWSITESELRITSLEIRQKKIAFQKEVSRVLGLKGEILRGLFPEAVQGRRFDLIATRAIRFSQRLWMEAEALLNPGGCLVWLTSPGEKEQGWSVIPVSEMTSLLLRCH